MNAIEDYVTRQLKDKLTTIPGKVKVSNQFIDWSTAVNEYSVVVPLSYNCVVKSVCQLELSFIVEFVCSNIFILLVFMWFLYF